MNHKKENPLLFPASYSLRSNALWISSVALLYFLLAQLSLSLRFEPEGIAAIWPPSGIFLSAILLTRRNLRPWLVGTLIIVDFISEMMAGTSWGVSLIYALALTGDAVFSAWLLQRFIGIPITFSRVRELIGWLLLSVLFSNASFSLVVAVANVWFLQGSTFWNAFFWWMSSAAIGNLVVTPFILSWAAWSKNRDGTSIPKMMLEGTILFALMGLLGQLYYTHLTTDDLYAVLLPYLVFPFLLWEAMRYGVRGVATTALTLATIAIFFLVTGTVTDDLFHVPTLDVLIISQLFLAIMIVPALFLAAALTERQQATEMLRESEDKFKYFFDYSIIGNAIIWPSGEFQANNELCKMLVYSPEELQHKMWQDISYPEDKELSQREINTLLSGEKEVAHYSKRFIKKDGSVIWVDIGSALRRDQVGNPLYFITALVDTTERRRAEAQIKLQAAALTSAANAIVITDRNGSIEWANPAFTFLTGYSAEEAVGQNPRILKSGVQNQAFYWKMWDTIQKGQVWHSELVNKRKDGSLYYEEETITPLHNLQGEISQFISIKQNVTQRKQDEEILKKNLQREEQIAALGRVLAKSRNLAEICRESHHALMNLTGCAYFAIAMLESKEDAIKMIYSASENTEYDAALYPLLDLRDPYSVSVYARPIQTHMPFIISGPIELPSWLVGSPNFSAIDMHSTCCLPMMAEDRVIGVIQLQSPRENDFARDDLEWLSVAANQVALSIQNARLFDEAQQRIADLSTLATIDSAVISHLEPQKLFEIILKQVSGRLKVDAVTLFLFRSKEQILECVSETGFYNKAILKMNLHLGESLTGKAAQSQKILHYELDNLENVDLLREASKLEGFIDYYGMPLLANSQLIGVLEIFHRSRLAPDANWYRFFEILANQAAIAIQTIQLYNDIQISNNDLLKAYDLTIEGWSRAMDMRDQETEYHTRRVTELTLRLAKRLGVSDAQTVDLFRGALLHDIGKLGVPDRILLKTGRLTEEEWGVMRKHPQFAFEMLNQIEYLRPALDIPYCHHEKWDGTGYPRGLKGELIPFGARLFALVDVYDALTSDRPYRKAWSRERTLNYIREQSGKHFDPRVVEAFLSLLQTGELGQMI